MKKGLLTSRIAWLHISDIHLPPGNDDSYLSDRVLKALVETLKRRGSKIDLIFFTGDLADKGKDYSKAQEFFDDLLDASGLIKRFGINAKKRLFIIPGNHDVDMDKNPFITRTLSEKELNAFFNPVNNDREGHFERHHRFIDFYNNYFKGIRSLSNEEPFISENITLKVHDNNLNIAIIGLISTWFCRKDGDINQLYVGERLCEYAINKTVNNAKNDITIILQHHPLLWLHPLEIENLKNLITSNSDIFLSGHIHDNEIVQIINEYGKLLECGAGTVYVGPDKQKILRALYGFLDLDTGLITIKAIRYSKKRKEWVWDTDYRIQEYEIRNKNILLNKFKNKSIDVPIMIFAMNSLEASSLFDGSLFIDNSYDQEDIDNFNDLKRALVDNNINGLEKNYCDERELWKPFISADKTIQEIINNAFNQINEEFNNLGLPRMKARFYKFDLFLDSTKQKKYVKTFKEDGGVIVIDPVSLYCPSISVDFLKLGLISCKKISSILFSPICYQDFQVNHLIENLIGQKMPDIITSFNNNFSSLCEIGVSDTRVFKRRLFSAYPYSPGFVRNYILSRNIDYMYNLSSFEEQNIEKLWS